ncbi:hypothetical protein CPLU01_08891 [Colletotrichum plurivorum]|uniref:Uncharacterized protein n=1 Tax=Colletotrichum plurivorum TaxID=2175906 RepID=A0A8H6NBU0_9PEZI|nr:hypothetical protein CPLU01_08891 [Colletotrichum plurivorum]
MQPPPIDAEPPAGAVVGTNCDGGICMPDRPMDAHGTAAIASSRTQQYPKRSAADTDLSVRCGLRLLSHTRNSVVRPPVPPGFERAPAKPP